MYDDIWSSMIIFGFILLIVVSLIFFANKVIKIDKQIVCYRNYIETNVITTDCEEYFQNIKIGER